MSTDPVVAVGAGPLADHDDVFFVRSERIVVRDGAKIPPELLAQLDEVAVVVVDRDEPYGRLLLRLERAVTAQAQTFRAVDEVALAKIEKQLRVTLGAVLEQAVDRLVQDAAAQLAQAASSHTGMFLGGPAHPDPTFIAEESHHE